MAGLRILIADDEPLGRERLRLALAARQDVEVAAEAADGDEAVQLLAENTFDLAFLDIQMPHRTGFEVVEAVGPEAMPPVIFVTAYDEFALRAFQVHALDYLLKPVEEAKLYASLDRVIKLVSDRGDLTDRIREALADVAGAKEYATRLMIRGRSDMHFVKVADIDWIEASGNYVTLHSGGQTHLIRQTMASVADKLDPGQFARIHRSTMVNLDRIRDIRPTFHGEHQVRLADGTELRLSRTYRAALKRFEL